MGKISSPPESATLSLDSALAWLQGNLPAVAKDERADVIKDGKKLYDYQYATLTDVSAAILPLLSVLGLSWRCRPTMELLGDAWRFVLHYELKHLEGEKIEGYWPLPDRADPQVVGSAITYARRYCLCAVVGLAPGGDDDGTAAKEASRQGERLSSASELSLPPDDTERLVAMLEPNARTPLADYRTMWQVVVRRRAAGKPSPIEHDGQLLTWEQAFGFSLARRIDCLSSPADCRAFFNEAKAAGWDVALCWPWDGVLPRQRLIERGKQATHELEEATRIAELAVASASTLNELAVAEKRIRNLLPFHEPARHESLELLVQGRRASMIDALTQQGTQEEAGSGEERGDGESGAVADRLMAVMWDGAFGTLQMRDDLLGAHERGEITQEDYAALFEKLEERPEPADTSYEFLFWQATEATHEDQLDHLKERVKALVKSNHLDELEERSILGQVSATRIHLKGERYR